MKRKEFVFLGFVVCFFCLLLLYVVSIFIRASSSEHQSSNYSAIVDVITFLLAGLGTIFNFIYTQSVKKKSEYLERWNGVKASGSYYLQFFAIQETDADLKTVYQTELPDENQKEFLTGVSILFTGDSPTVFKFISAFEEGYFLKHFANVDSVETDGSSRSSYSFDDEAFFKYCSSHPEGSFPFAIAYPALYVDSNDKKEWERLEDNALVLTLRAEKENETFTIWFGGYSEDDYLIFIRATIKMLTITDNTCECELIQEYPYYYFDGKIHSYTKGIYDK